VRTYQAALSDVLKWVRDAGVDSPTIKPIPGIGDPELKQLARLAALLRVRLIGRAPHPLVDALTPAHEIPVDKVTSSAFDALIEEDAVGRLADLYASIVAPAKRRPLGTFFTPREYAQAIVDGFASRHSAPGQIIDVGAGVGIFSEIAHSKWPSASIHAIDINPLTLGLQAVAAARSSRWDVKLVLADYGEWLNSFSPGRPTLYLGNPPYTRWQLLDKEARADLLQAANGLTGSRANLSTLFLAMTLARLQPDDSIAMIIPAGWMRADYGGPLRQGLRARARRRISLRMADSWRFQEAIVDAVLVEIGPESSTTQPIEVSDWAGSEVLTLDRAEGQGAFAAPGRARWTSARPKGSSERPLAAFAKVTRGTASGASKFFVKSTAEWETLGIPPKYRQPLARRLRRGTDRTAPIVETAEILVLKGYARGTDASTDTWISIGEREGLQKLHLCSKRRSWFDLSAEVKTPEVIISALAREEFHVFENPNRLAIMNNLFGLHWVTDLASEDTARVLEWLRGRDGQAALRSSASVEANGLYRLSPRAVGALTVETASLSGIASKRETSR
jgi:hypothetical protein